MHHLINNYWWLKFCSSSAHSKWRKCSFQSHDSCRKQRYDIVHNYGTLFVAWSAVPGTDTSHFLELQEKLGSYSDLRVCARIMHVCGSNHYSVSLFRSPSNSLQFYHTQCAHTNAYISIWCDLCERECKDCNTCLTGKANNDRETAVTMQ
jgi:hypothetical protein